LGKNCGNECTGALGFQTKRIAFKQKRMLLDRMLADQLVLEASKRVILLIANV
jgi:hypothetical protein